ncbi:hypothetical protein QEJ31_00310 [Pigmentibacter sp. JX0631]|uniref:hypothetical protein n=1 Tax=Pigmentibacter sp. JX0631 TaxID=2976982 RepID=UPI002469B4A4|nr:hypothetical protein [Pigmentibacter sp. JX0631]WGL60045.1 hypothetical protein QEJ31_00310 [Pigmentibacter sp. JX0631]
MLKKYFNPTIIGCVILSNLSVTAYATTSSCKTNTDCENQHTISNPKLVASIALLNYLGQKKINNAKSIPNYKKENIEIDLSDYRSQMANYDSIKDTSDITYKILRAVMRNPSSELLVSLQELHKNFRIFIPNDPVTLNWILGGLKLNEKKFKNGIREANPFVARTSWKNIDDLKNFLDADATQMNPSLLIVGLESLACALAYRSVNGTWIEEANPPLKPITPSTQIRADFINSLYHLNYQWSVPYIGALFDKNIESAPDNTTSLDPDSYFSSNYNGYLSEVSDDEDESEDENSKKKRKRLPDSDCDHSSEAENPTKKKKCLSDSVSVQSSEAENPTKKRLPKNNFYKTSQIDGVYGNTWTFSAHNAGLAVRANVSGTAPLALSIFVGLANNYHSPHLQSLLWNPSDFQAFKKGVQLLGTLLLVPNYERSDYHTVAETYVGITYYVYKLNEIRKDSVQKFPIDFAKLHPIDSYNEAMANLSEASSNEQYSVNIKGTGIQIISLKEAIKTVADDYLIAKVDKNRIPFHTTGY